MNVFNASVHILGVQFAEILGDVVVDLHGPSVAVNLEQLS
jgi:hypothetical protein